MMVKLTGPGLARGASGSLADELIFSNWKGTPYLKQHRKPTQPRSPAQVAMRAIMRFIANIWREIPATDQDDWLELAATTDISPFNACQGYNLKRWRNQLCPCTILPPDQGLTAQDFSSWNVYPAIRHVRHDITSAAEADGIGFAIHRQTTLPITFDWDNLIHMIPVQPFTGAWTWTDHLPAGTYHYAARAFAKDGTPRSGFYRTNVVVTD